MQAEKTEPVLVAWARAEFSTSHTLQCQHLAGVVVAVLLPGRAVSN